MINVTKAKDISPSSGSLTVIAGPPGTGKSNIAGTLAEYLSPEEVLVIATLPREVNSRQYQKYNLDTIVVTDDGWEPSEGKAGLRADGFDTLLTLLRDLRADEKYKGIKARLDAGGETAKRATARLNYANAEAKIKAMVEAGEVSAEDAEKRLNRMRERIAGDGSEKQSKEARTFTIEEYKEAAAKIKAMVDEGKVNAEDAEIRLNRMRQATERKTRDPK